MADNSEHETGRDGTSRRVVLKAGAIGGVVAAVSWAGGGEVEAMQEPDVGDFELEEVAVGELHKMLEAGELTSRRITELYIGRIEALDPRVRSILEVNPDTLEIADELDSERRSGASRGPLHGIPIVVKDNLDTHDRMTTTAGSLALEGSIPLQDSSVVAGLREAGAVILGKANLSEWANFRSSRSSSGWSGRGGQCRNPYVTSRTPCGSSSGSGVATAASFCGAAIGTETNGSIICPSTINGLVGIKPTVGLVSRAGIIPISQSQDTAGPMARTVEDAAMVLGAITAVDTRDPATVGRPGGVPGDYTRYLDRDGLRGARLGINRSRFGFHEKVDRVMETAIQAMREAGAEIIDELELEVLPELQAAAYEVMLYEFKAGMAAYLSTLGDGVQVRTLADIIAFNEGHRDREMPYFAQETFHEAQAKGPLTDPAYVNALATSRRLARTEGIDRLMDEHRLDGVVSPSGGPAWTIDLVNGDHYGGGSSTMAAVAGYPHITVPAGLLHGLPVGISIFGRAWSEGKLISIAYGLEQETQARRSPRFLDAITSG